MMVLLRKETYTCLDAALNYNLVIYDILPYNVGNSGDFGY